MNKLALQRGMKNQYWSKKKILNRMLLTIAIKISYSDNWVKQNLKGAPQTYKTKLALTKTGDVHLSQKKNP